MFVKPIFIFCLFITSLSGFSAPAASEQSLKIPLDANPVFATSIVHPWGMSVEDNPSGLLIESINALNKESRINHNNILRPYTQVIYELNSGFSDLAIGFESSRIELEAIKIGEIQQTRLLVMVLPKNNLGQTIEQLKNFKIGHLKGSNFSQYFGNPSHFELLPLKSLEEGITMLQLGRIDGLTALDHTLYYQMGKMGLTENDMNELINIPGPMLSLYISKKSKHKDLIPIYEKAIKALSERKELERIFENPRRWIH